MDWFWFLQNPLDNLFQEIKTFLFFVEKKKSTPQHSRNQCHTAAIQIIIYDFMYFSFLRRNRSSSVIPLHITFRINFFHFFILSVSWTSHKTFFLPNTDVDCMDILVVIRSNMTRWWSCSVNFRWNNVKKTMNFSWFLCV